MTTLLFDRPPSDDFLTWSVTQPFLKLPLDRPWLQAAPPYADVPEWEYICRCSRPTSPVAVLCRRFECRDAIDANHKNAVWVGQCRRCERILWSVRPVTF